MKAFRDLHPACATVYFLAVLIIAGFSFNPFFLVPLFFGTLLFYGSVKGCKRAFSSGLKLLLLIVVIAAVNPLFSHNGATVLFFLNDSRITLEALIYGGVLGLAAADAVLIFMCVNTVFDSERIIYLFGRYMPNIGLVISMALGFVPKLRAMYASVSSAQRGLQKSRVKRALRCFSAVITQSMEGAIITSDSMRSRGYGTGKRTFFNRFRVFPRDLIFGSLFIVLFTLSILPLILGDTAFVIYPVTRFSAKGIMSGFGLSASAVLAFFPFLYELTEGLKWKYSISKI